MDAFGIPLARREMQFQKVYFFLGHLYTYSPTVNSLYNSSLGIKYNYGIKSIKACKQLDSMIRLLFNF